MWGVAEPPATISAAGDGLIALAFRRHTGLFAPRLF
jgi:hypothetical protein